MRSPPRGGGESLTNTSALTLSWLRTPSCKPGADLDLPDFNGFGVDRQVRAGLYTQVTSFDTVPAVSG
jgi:hypothetical protein